MEKLTKRGVEICCLLIYAGKTRYAVASLMQISFGAATHRYKAWEKAGGLNRVKQPVGLTRPGPVVPAKAGTHFLILPCSVRRLAGERRGHAVAVDEHLPSASSAGRSGGDPTWRRRCCRALLSNRDWRGARSR